MNDEIAYAIHKDDENPNRVELGFKNLTKNEAKILLLVLNQLQKSRSLAKRR